LEANQMRTDHPFFALLISGLMLGCGTADVAEDDDGGSSAAEPQPTGVALLGNGQHTLDSVSFVEIAGAAQQLFVPRDVSVNPLNPNELWAINQADDSMIVITNPGTPQQSSERFWGSGGQHFMANPSAMAMGNNGFFATIHEEDQLTQGPSGTPADFMGPTLWRSNTAEFEAGHASHFDMLHNSPNGMGIAWERDNRYWVFDGYHSSITMYDFVGDHGPGGADHSDGMISRYVEGQVSRVPGVPSHMAFNPGTTHLYVADTGNARIAMLDIASGTPGADTYPNYDSVPVHNRFDNATLTTVIDGAEVGMMFPSGLEIHDGHIYVTDINSSTVYAFTLEGELVDWLNTELPGGSLGGMSFDQQGRVYLSDALNNRVFQLAALAE
jgi:DNA-binding beta-propeller fold protein YncE